jgi:hypothetical protein
MCRARSNACRPHARRPACSDLCPNNKLQKKISRPLPLSVALVAAAVGPCVVVVSHHVSLDCMDGPPADAGARDLGRRAIRCVRREARRGAGREASATRNTQDWGILSGGSPGSRARHGRQHWLAGLEWHWAGERPGDAPRPQGMRLRVRSFGGKKVQIRIRRSQGWHTWWAKRGASPSHSAPGPPCATSCRAVAANPPRPPLQEGLTCSVCARGIVRVRVCVWCERG